MSLNDSFVTAKRNLINIKQFKFNEVDKNKYDSSQGKDGMVLSDYDVSHSGGGSGEEISIIKKDNILARL
jgi:hypothetical protein